VDKILFLDALKAERKKSTATTGKLLNREKILKTIRTETHENRTEKIAIERTRNRQKIFGF